MILLFLELMYFLSLPFNVYNTLIAVIIVIAITLLFLPHSQGNTKHRVDMFESM